MPTSQIDQVPEQRGGVRHSTRKFSRISNNPEAFGRAPEAEVLRRDLRQVLFKTGSGLIYRAVFLIENAQIYVLRIRGPGQPPLTNDEIDLA